jgi:antitoxin CcdA
MRTGIAMSSTQTDRRVRTGMPAKRATNLSLSSDVLQAAKQLEINISQVCDKHLREVV